MDFGKFTEVVQFSFGEIVNRQNDSSDDSVNIFVLTEASFLNSFYSC